MKKLLAGVLAILLSLVAMSDDGKDIKAEVTSAVEAFNTAYATNDVETYFSNYTDDAMLFFYGARQPVSVFLFTPGRPAFLFSIVGFRVEKGCQVYFRIINVTTFSPFLADQLRSGNG